MQQNQQNKLKKKIHRSKTQKKQLESSYYESFQTRIKQEKQICNRAIQSLNKGYRLIIDLKTYNNFKVALPTLPHKIKKNQPNFDLPISGKRYQLNRLLHQKKERYMLSSQQQKDERKLFPERKSLRIKVKSLIKKQYSPQKRQSLQECQERLLQQTAHSELIKDSLRIKFKEIRESLNCKKRTRNLSKSTNWEF